MIIKPQPFPRPRSGYALIIIMLFLAVSLIVFGSMMSWVSSNAKITIRNNVFNTSQAAAESATEVMLASEIRDFSFQSLNAASSYASLYPDQTGWPVGYQFTTSVAMGTTNWTVLDSQFIGLYAQAQYCTNTVTATPTNAQVTVPATIQQIIQFASIPVFQFAVFYNMDLEVNPGAAMTINGHVHSNNNIWTTGPSGLTYSYLVDASQMLYYTRSPNDPQASTLGTVTFTITANNPLNNVPSLTMPIGTNNNPASVAGILGLPPSVVIAPMDAAYSPTGSVYLYNGADLIISNSASTNLSVFYDNQFTTPRLTPVPPDVLLTTSTTNNKGGVTITTNATYYSFLTNSAFYDYRESDTVKAVDIDVGKLRTWLTNASSRGGNQYNNLNNSGSTSKGHSINSAYVYNSISPVAGTSGTPGTLPAVRLVNGQRLPSAGLTIATAQPLYVKGDYNTTTNGTTFANSLGSTTNGNTVPAAIMADAVTILSSAWSDANNSGTSLGSRNAQSTTINAACLEGIVASYTDSGGTKHYSGGLENFLRMLEDWSGDTLTYNGSIVVMFPSQYATNNWINPGTYYNPPTRNWGFDVNFSKGPQYLPPLTPQVKETIRSSWATQ